MLEIALEAHQGVCTSTSAVYLLFNIASHLHAEFDAKTSNIFLIKYPVRISASVQAKYTKFIHTAVECLPFHCGQITSEMLCLEVI